MRLRLPNGRPVRQALVYTTAAVLIACGGAEEKREPLASASEADRANEPPRIVSVALEPETPEPGGSVRVVVDVVDPDGDPVKMTYEWTLAGEPVGGGRPKLALREGSRADRLAVTVVASDGRADSEPAIARVHLANRPPQVDRLLIGPALEITAGTEVEVEAQAHDDDGDELSFHHAWTVNGEKSGDSGPVFATGALQNGDVLAVAVRANDGMDEGDALTSPPIRVVNLPPHVVSRPGPSPPEGGFRYLVQAEDPDGDDSLRFELEQAPDGMEIDEVTGEVMWTPRKDQAGRHQVRVVVDDQKGGRIAHAFEVEVGGAYAPTASVGR